MHKQLFLWTGTSHLFHEHVCTFFGNIQEFMQWLLLWLVEVDPIKKVDMPHSLHNLTGFQILDLEESNSRVLSVDGLRVVDYHWQLLVYIEFGVAFLAGGKEFENLKLRFGIFIEVLIQWYYRAHVLLLDAFPEFGESMPKASTGSTKHQPIRNWFNFLPLIRMLLMKWRLDKVNVQLFIGWVDLGGFILSERIDDVHYLSVFFFWEFLIFAV